MLAIKSNKHATLCWGRNSLEAQRAECERWNWCVRLNWSQETYAAQYFPVSEFMDEQDFVFRWWRLNFGFSLKLRGNFASQQNTFMLQLLCSSSLFCRFSVFRLLCVRCHSFIMFITHQKFSICMEQSHGGELGLMDDEGKRKLLLFLWTMTTTMKYS